MGVRTRLRTTSLALAIVAIVVASSCSSEQSSSSIELDPGDPLLAVSELERLEYWAGRFEGVEASVQSCMAAQGFEYRPRSHFSAMAPPPPGRIANFGSEGYGISSVAIAAVAAMREFGLQPPPQPPSLTPAERDAYSIALTGSPGIANERPSADSCQGIADLEARNTESNLDALASVADVVEARTEADPRMIALHADWSRCMANSGYDYRHPDDPVIEFEILIEEMVDGGALRDPGGPTMLKLLEELEEVLAAEEAVARVDRECQLPTRDVRRQIWRDNFLEAGLSDAEFQLLNP